MILVAGGTGRLGAMLVDRLAGRGLEVSVLTRDPVRARSQGSRLVRVVRGDVRDPASLAAATVGVRVVVSAAHGFAEPEADALAAVDRHGNANLVAAARGAGADIVLISTVGAKPDSPMELFRVKYAAEQHAIASGVPTTIVRATAFLELWVELLRQTAAGRSQRPLVFGRGQNPINFVSIVDVAALAERVVTDPSACGEVLEIGGPANLMFDQLASAVQTAAGRTGRPRHVPPSLLRLMAETIGRIRPALGRQARAALVMDTLALTFDASPIRHLYPDLPCTALTDVLSSTSSRRQPDRTTVAP